MSDTTSYSRKLVPLIRCVNAAIIDQYEDIGKTQERYLHWAAREIKELNRQVLRTGKRYAIITVNRNTNTATLPLDLDELIFVGLLDENNEKIPLRMKDELGNSKVEEIECVDKCPKCQQDKAICNDLTVTESTTLVTINDSIYEQTVIKKLYPNGDYYLETRIPLWDIEAGVVVYTTNKEFITNISLKPCGCIDITDENLEKVKCCCPEAYACYYAGCNNSCMDQYGGYRHFEQTGFLQFDNIGTFTKAYIEYWGFLPKKNGQYHIPEVAFETVVEKIKFMAIDGKKNIPNIEKRWRLDRYKEVKANMKKIIGRINLSQIIESIGLIPKFDLNEIPWRSGCLTPPKVITAAAETTDCNVPDVCPPASSGGSGGSGGGSGQVYTPFSISTIAGLSGTPVPGTNTYQDNKLIGALGVVMIIVNNNNETIAAQQFTLDTVTGIITRYQGDGATANNWQSGDVLVVPTFFKLV